MNERRAHRVRAGILLAASSLVVASLWLKSEARGGGPRSPEGRSTFADEPDSPPRDALSTPAGSRARMSPVALLRLLGNLGGSRIPLANGEVILRPVPAGGENPAPPVRRTFSDPDGWVRFEVPPTRRWGLEARAAGFLGLARVLTSEELAALGEVQLEALGVVHGRVRDSSGSPVPGAAVRAAWPPRVAHRFALLHPIDREPGSRCVTDSGGRFSLPSLLPGSPMALNADSQGHDFAETEIAPLTPGEVREVELTLEAETSIVGTLPPDHPAGASARLWLFSVREETLFESEASLVLRGERKFRFRNVPPGRKRVVYELEEPNLRVFGFADAEAIKGRIVDVGVIPVRDSSLLITLELEGKEPGPREALLGLDVFEGNPGDGPAAVATFSTRIPVDEEFYVRGLPGGELKVSAVLMNPSGSGMDRAYEGAHAALRFRDHDRIRISIGRRARHGFGALVLLLDPPPGVAPTDLDARVLILEGERYVTSIRGSTQGHGEHTFDRLRAGEYEIRVVANGWCGEPLLVRIAPGERIRAHLRSWSAPAPRLSGRVVDEGGAPVPGTLLEVALGPEGEVVLEERSDGEGRYRFREVYPLRGLLLTARGPRGSASGPVPLEPGASADDWVLALRFP